MLEDALELYGDPRSKVIWGNNSNNPTGYNSSNTGTDWVEADTWIWDTFGQ